MFCSVIIPTIGRASLARAVNSALDQDFHHAPFAVIVVNDSGAPLPPEPWQASDRVTILHTQRRERSFARNAGAAVARGAYYYFLDDDDWLLPGALQAFWALAQRAPDAAWLLGGVRVVGADGVVLAERNSDLEGASMAQIMGGAWAPIQSSIICARDYHAVGGYDPSIGVTQDQDLCRKVAARGQFANTKTVVACLFRGADWRSSTDYGMATENTRRSRDAIAALPGALRVMLASADDSYWRGRVVHICLGLALWHCRRRRFSKGVSRLLQGAAAMLFSFPHVARRSFWRALRDDHAPGSLHFIQMAWEDEAA